MLIDKMYKYEKDPTRTLGATERIRNAGRADGRTDGQSETNIPPTTSLCGGYNDTHDTVTHPYPFLNVQLIKVPPLNLKGMHKQKRKGRIARVTALVVTWDVEACFQRLQWRSGQSSWRPLGFCVYE